ncbi:hypothetical protein D3C84_988550 [compost metagenome]
MGGSDQVGRLYFSTFDDLFGVSLSKPTTSPVNQYCKKWGDHRFFVLHKNSPLSENFIIVVGYFLHDHMLKNRIACKR